MGASAVKGVVAAAVLALVPATVGARQAPEALQVAATVSVRPATRAYAVRVAPNEVLHVEATGTGPAVVVVPGLFGSAYGFRNVVGPLADAGRRVIVVEPLGIGSSGRPKAADYSLEAQARRVAAVMDSMHLTGATVVAHSVGSSIAFRLALAHPALVRDVVSLEGGVAESAGTPGLRQALGMASLLGHFGLESVVRSKLRAKFRESSGDPSWVTDATMAGYMAPVRNDFQNVIAAYRAMASAPEPAALAPRLPRLRVPVQLLLGAAEHEGGPGDNEVALMRARIPGLRVVEVPGAGHWIQEERPQAVIATVMAASR